MKRRRGRDIIDEMAREIVAFPGKPTEEEVRKILLSHIYRLALAEMAEDPSLAQGRA